MSEESIGWLYFNEDTGTEFSNDHPVESGEVPDAKHVRPATAEALLAELFLEWGERHEAQSLSASLEAAKAENVELTNRLRAYRRQEELLLEDIAAVWEEAAKVVFEVWQAHNQNSLTSTHIENRYYHRIKAQAAWTIYDTIRGKAAVQASGPALRSHAKPSEVEG